MKFGEIQLQNDIFMILGGPWPARAGNLDIPIGILRFLSLPGPLRSLQNRENHKISFEIALFQSKTGFSAFGPQKMPPERYVYKGFYAPGEMGENAVFAEFAAKKAFPRVTMENIFR